MICLSLQDITYSIGDNTILNRISFSINEDCKIGIVGVNGAGKTTLLKIISGKTEPDSGNIYIAKDKKVGMLEQNQICESDLPLYDYALEVFGDLTEMEKELETLRHEVNTNPSLAQRLSNLQDDFNNKGGNEYKSKTRGVLISLGFNENDLQRKVSSFSGGQKTRISLAVLLLSHPDVLILDEPTNHLDANSMEWLANCLKSYKGTVLVVSHDRWFLDCIATDIVEIEFSRVTMWHGNYTKYVESKEKDYKERMHRWESQQKEIKRIQEYIAQQRRWGRERNIIAAESREKLLDKMEKVEKPEELTEALRLRFAYSGESGNEVVNVYDMSFSYPNKKIFSDFSCCIRKGERIFIVGENGCGKSTLMKILAGIMLPTKGNFEWGAKVRFGYYDQENQNLTSGNTVVDELWDTYPDKTNTEIRNALALFLFKGDDVIKTTDVLSGGEASRLTLAKLSLKKVNVLLLDEPTNHLDIKSREVLEEALINFPGTIICVSHDRYFVNKLSTRILEFKDGNICNFDGDFNAWHQQKQQGDIRTKEKEQITDSKKDYEQQKQEQATKRKKAAAIEKAKKRSEEIENELTLLEIEIENNSSDHVKLAELWEQKETLENELLECYEILT